MLASVALVVLTGHRPALADTTITGGAGGQNWTSGNFTVTNSGMIIASTAIVSSGSSLGTLTIDALGKLTASYSGLDNASSIAAMVNNGTISDGNVGGNADHFGVNNSGTIGTITNSGTITGSNYYYAIDNSGSIGTILNQGTISGIEGIVNDGPSGSIGTITNNGKIDATDGIVNNGTISTLVNTGTILAHASSGVGVLNGNGSYIDTLVNTGTIQGGGEAGIWNQGGSIGVLSNSGLITDAQWGIRNSGQTLSTLDNLSGGTIYGGDVGVNNTGTIGTITNNGVISGGNYALYNTGSLGLITNSGTIIGNIYSSSTLSIAGGDSSHYGTLSEGTITVGSGGHGTLDISSGYLWLQDAVASNVVNRAATLKLTNPIPISGNYTQSGGGLVIATSNNGSSYGYLTVSGTASITNTHITISGTGLTVGQTFTIVQASSGSYSNDTASVSGTAKLRARLSTSGNDLAVTLAPADTYQTIGLAAGASGVGAALDTLSNAPTTSADMRAILSMIDGLPSPSSQALAMKELGPAQSTPSPQMLFSASQVVLGAVEQHQQGAMAYNPSTGIAAGSEASQNAVWGQVLGGNATRGTTADADGYHMREFGLAAGVDRLFADNLMGGVALSWVRAYASGSDTANTNSTLDNYMLTGYGSYRVGQLVFDGQAGLGYGRFHQKRHITFLDRTASADYGSKQYLLRGRAGYDIPVAQDMTVTLLAGLTWLRSVNDGYTETGAGADNLRVDSRDASSLSHDLGAKVSWSLDTSWGRLKPEVRAEWVHDYRQGAYITSGSLDGAAFTAATPRINPDGAQIALAATLDRSNRLSFRAEYDGEMRPNFRSHIGMVKAIWNF